MFTLDNHSQSAYSARLFMAADPLINTISSFISS